jgi:hypothetical protein
MLPGKHDMRLIVLAFTMKNLSQCRQVSAPVVPMETMGRPKVIEVDVR